MEDLSMFQRPRTVAMEDENPGTYGTVLIYPLNRLVECGFMGDTAVHPWVDIFCRRQGFARENLGPLLWKMRTLGLMEGVDLPTRSIGRVWLHGLYAKHQVHVVFLKAISTFRPKPWLKKKRSEKAGSYICPLPSTRETELAAVSSLSATDTSAETHPSSLVVSCLFPSAMVDFCIAVFIIAAYFCAYVSSILTTANEFGSGGFDVGHVAHSTSVRSILVAFTLPSTEMTTLELLWT
ncbi:hypothetical protein PIB30_087715 [Stylosanthes scabra]|uniref:Uncharacterized protein n=1 Tax=Stylosanthes scabra TaxID=79078 RepID=A0ABU6VTT2_9FABA|nr:hypothetical protein [Stylosanthes scabra]